MKRKALYTFIVAATCALMVACDGDDGKNGRDGADGAAGVNGVDGVDGADAYTDEIRFTKISPSITDAEKNAIRSTSEVMVGGETQYIDYHLLLATGDEDNGEVFGLVKDFQDNIIKYEDDSDYLCNGTDSGTGSGLDHFSFLQKGDKLYMVSQFECAPGAMYMNELQQEADGQLALKAGTLQYVSQKEEFGGWVHCAGMTTPWQSHLGSEEYEPNAADPLSDNYYNEVTLRFWGNDANLNNPYYYGWTPEVDVNEDGTPAFSKHYSMGRFAHELAYVMPDEKTVYLSDDGSNVGLFMFIADTAADLSAGTLYAAKWNQVSGEGLGEAVISWVDLGHATNAEIRTRVASQMSFGDIFASEAPVGGACPTVGFTYINTYNGEECLQLQDVDGSGSVDEADGVIASRLETRRYAAMMGATTEFRKEEGITFNARDKVMYVAMSRIQKGMTDGAGDIQLEENKCGGVYALNLGINEAYSSEFVAYDMKGLVAGLPASYSGTSLEGNSCDVEGLAEPDNVAFLEGTDILVIGEDAGYHISDMVWAYDITKKSLTRIASTPYGSETTSPYWYKDVNGFSYLTLTTQHPFGEVSGSYVRPDGVDIRSTAGYIGPFDFTKLK
ncbi:PhoX family protein [Halioxenophilus sp. WMMB6]|uniref:PhoX family protein n=1 Tax=Halioxenophilus sp. WMMB6 TaxID=3073815 RepID=UPI00295F1ED2|nr:alkaline phosphatase PhoX [Halioxenophilus sp. WMMB6]